MYRGAVVLSGSCCVWGISPWVAGYGIAHGTEGYWARFVAMSVLGQHSYLTLWSLETGGHKSTHPAAIVCSLLFTCNQEVADLRC